MNKNSINRTLPDTVPLYGRVRPYTGTSKQNRRAELDLPDRDDMFSSRDTDRRPEFISSLKDAVRRAGLQDGMRISFHHHLRLGDRVLEMVLDVLTEMGFHNLILCLSSVMGSSCAAVLKAVHNGVISMIETTGLKAPLATAVQRGELSVPVIFRSHGGRARAIESGDILIDVAFIAASAVDEEGNLCGSRGPNRFGSLGYAFPDAHKAKCVIGISDRRLPAPIPVAIPSYAVDMVVMVSSIGSRSGLSGGSIRRTKRPVEKLIASRTLSVILASGAVTPGFSFQAGSGGISLEVSSLLAEYLKDTGIPCSFVSGGITGPLVSMLNDGITERLYDVQSFDDEAAVSIGINPGHIEMSASLYANPLHPQCIAHQLDVMILSATEVDLQFHVNSITGTDGRILGALGGAPDTAAGAQLTIVVLPSFRGRIPSVNRDVYTVCTPGETVDVVVTERGIAVNPLRQDLIERFHDVGIRTVTIEQLMERVHGITGVPAAVKRDPEDGRVLAVVEYRDGSVLDCIWG